MHTSVNGFEPGMTRWRGVDRQGMIAHYRRSRWLHMAIACVPLAPAVWLVAVMSTGPWWWTLGVPAIAAWLSVVAVHAVAVVVGPRELALLPEGLLVRLGLIRHFIPWSTTDRLDVEWVSGGERESDDYEELRIRVRDHAVIESNWAGRAWRLLYLDGRVPIPVRGLSMSAEALRVALRTATSERPSAAGAMRASKGVVGDVVDAVMDRRKEFAILHADKATNRYIQIVMDGDGNLYAEAVSDGYLPRHAQLTADDIEQLHKLGWSPPATIYDNFSRTFMSDAQAKWSAATDVLERTLHGVYGLPPGRDPIVELGPDLA